MCFGIHNRTGHRSFMPVNRRVQSPVEFWIARNGAVGFEDLNFNFTFARRQTLVIEDG